MEVKATGNPLVAYYRIGVLSLMMIWMSVPACCQSDTIQFPDGWISVQTMLDSLSRAGHPFFYRRAALDTRRMIRTHGAMNVEDTRKAFLSGLVVRSFPDTRTKFIYRSEMPVVSAVLPMFVVVTVRNSNGDRLAGANLTSSGMRRAMTTNDSGTAIVYCSKFPDTIRCSYTGSIAQEAIVFRQMPVDLVMNIRDTMQTLLVAAYFQTRRRELTGQVAVVEQRNRPPGNVLDMMDGQVAGVLVTTTSGVPGSAKWVYIRGRSSILNSNDPMFVIDGVPFAAANQSSSYVATGNAGGSLSPFTFIAIEDIESMKVLSDADATAIYGSKGANGVVLITTKQARRNGPRIGLTIASGLNWVWRRPRLLNTTEYAAMRFEGFANDHSQPDDVTAPDLMIWDTTGSNDWGKWIIGGRGHLSSQRVTWSGSPGRFNHTLAISRQEETTPFPTAPGHTLYSFAGNINGSSPDSLWTFQAFTAGAFDKNNQFNTDPTLLQYLAPNAPLPWDAYGNLVWRPDNVYYGNPMGALAKRYEGRSRHFLASGNFQFKFAPWGTVVVNGGKDDILTREWAREPILSKEPSALSTGTSYFSHAGFRSWMFEPQVNIKLHFSDLRMELLSGYTLQGYRTVVNTMKASGYTDDRLLQDKSKATSWEEKDQRLDYLYKAAWSRVNLNYRNTYILDLTGRYDGSSRFKAAKRYGVFGAAGFAWIFSDGAFFRKKLSVLHFGKLRASYGVTGNDGIGGPAYLPTTSSNSAVSFQNNPGVGVAGPLNADVSWEIVRKLELAADLGFLHNTLLFSLCWYQHRSSNQLLPEGFPLMGTSGSLRNMPVTIGNKGWELSVIATPVKTQQVDLTIQANISLPVSRLLRYPNAGTGASEDLFIGQSLNTVRTYHSLGVHPDSGYFRFEDHNKDGRVDSLDRYVLVNMDVTCFGGLTNELRIGRWRFSHTLTFRIQKLIDPQSAIYTANKPGTRSNGMYANETTDILDRWPGKNARYRALSAQPGLQIRKNISQWQSSDAIIADGSFVRLKQISLAYELPLSFIKKAGLRQCAISIEAMNLFTWTSFRQWDPEVPRIQNLPPLTAVQCRISIGL